MEDEPALADLLVRAMRDVGWAADVAGSGEEALSALARIEYDLVVLDIGLPGIDGFEVCRRWRARGGKTPVLVLSARGELEDRVVGLDVGADDYLPKPFEVAELMARLRALARRPHPMLGPTLRFADLTLDTVTRTAARAGLTIPLTTREYALLEYLLRNPRRVLSRSQILEHVWDDNFDPVGNVVDVLVGRVRRKVDSSSAAALIHTMRGAGYVLTDQPPPHAD